MTKYCIEILNKVILLFLYLLAVANDHAFSSLLTFFYVSYFQELWSNIRHLGHIMELFLSNLRLIVCSFKVQIVRVSYLDYTEDVLSPLSASSDPFFPRTL